MNVGLFRGGCRGVSIAEALLTLTLVGLILVILGDLTRGLGKARQLSNNKMATLEIMDKVFPEIRRDIAFAVKIDLPTGTAQASILDLQHYNEVETDLGAAPRRLEFPARTFPKRDLSWDPKNPSYLHRVTYEVNGTNLERAEATNAPRVLAQVQSLQTRLQTGIYEVKITISEDGHVRVLKQNAVRP